MSKLLSAFTANGNFDVEMWFTTLFDEIPSKYALSIEDDKKCLDPKGIDFTKCSDLFPDLLAFRQCIEQVEEDPEAEELEFIEETQLPELDFIFGGEKAGSLFIATKNKRVFLLMWNKCVVFYGQEDNLEDVKAFVNKLWQRFPKAEEEEKAARVGLIKYSNGEYYTSFSDIRKTTVNIEENYNDDFVPVYNDVVEFLNQRESGLILLYGKAGSGNFL